ncbi:AzlD domain-containing protein [Lachnospiraceae bacterium JLR.KK008]
MNHSIIIYLIVAASAIYLIRALPMTLIRRDIKNPFVRSFLHYVPYVTLAVMTFPAILYATGNPLSAWAGFLVGVILAYVDGNLFRVAICSCVVVYLAELLTGH